MVTRKRTKYGVGKGSSSKLEGVLKEGDWLDVMDGDGVWNVARVLSVPSPEEVEITYDGWPKDFDEVVQVDSDRVAPYHTFTGAVKCWVKYLNWPLWPSLVTIRTPGTELGIRNLAAENRLHVDFLDSAKFDKRDRCWQIKRQVRAFEHDYDKKRTASTGAEFERALGWVLQADAPTKLPKFAGGTLPENYAYTTTKSVKEVREQMGEELWFQSFTNNRMRHQLTHVYDTIKDKAEYSSDDSSPEVTKRKLDLSATKSSPEITERELDLSRTKMEPQPVFREEKRPAPVEIEQEPSLDVEVPYELQPLDSSDDSSSEGDQGTNRTKRRRLRTRPNKENPTEKRRSSTPPASTLVPTRVPVGRKRSHPKGQIKMAARRSAPPVGGILNLTAGDVPIAIYSSDEDDNGEDGAVDSRDAARSPLPRPATNHQAETSRKSEAELRSDASFTVKPPMSSRRSIERKIALAKEKLRALEQEKQRPTEDTLARRKWVRLSDPSPMSAGSQGRPQPISPRANKVETHRSKRASSALLELTGEVDDVLERQPLSPMNEPGGMTGGMAEELSDDLTLQPEKLGRSLLSEDKSCSSNSEKSKGIINEEVEINTSETKRVEQAGSKSQETLEVPVEPPNQLSVAESEPRRPFCVMQARKEDGELPDAKETVKISMKTIISVPRKFAETFRAPQVPAYSSPHSMLRIAPPPRPLFPSSSSALTSPSSGIFSSSKGFSMDGWFQRKLMRKFMNGGD